MDGKRIIMLAFMAVGIAHAVDENFYMGGQSYYNFGSSYYPKYTNDYYWGGDGWVFKTGYKAPTQRCCSRVKCTHACTWCNAYRKSLPMTLRQAQDENCLCNCNGVDQP